jgi:hypothetical protein
VFPGYRASRIVIDGASSTAFDGWGGLALAWLVVLTPVVALALRRMLARTAWRAETLHR